MAVKEEWPLKRVAAQEEFQLNLPVIRGSGVVSW